MVNPALATRSGAELTKDSSVVEQEKLAEQTTQVMLIEALWTKPYLAYLLHGELPEDAVHHRQIMHRSKSFTIIQGELYQGSTTGVLQRCIAPEDDIAMLQDIHEGTYGHHAYSQTLVAKALRSGFYRLSALHDAKTIVERCDACQSFATKLHMPASEL
jgi:hypothetical protein